LYGIASLLLSLRIPWMKCSALPAVEPIERSSCARWAQSPGAGISCASLNG
jgi:hypothetical protein